MEFFQPNYYANHVKFLNFLALNLEKVEEVQSVSGMVFPVTKEELHRDLASRAYYTVFLKIRDTLELSQETMHSSIKEKLAKEYKNIFLELKEMRIKADYFTQDENKFEFPIKLDKGTQYYSMRVITIMDKFLAANANQLTP